MVVKMMKWRPWPPLSARKFDTKINIRRVEGLSEMGLDDSAARLALEVKWKGSKKGSNGGLSSLKRRSVRRNFTREEGLREDGGGGVVEWDEEFCCVCNFSGCKEGGGGFLHPWKVEFTLMNVLNRVPKDKVPIVAIGSLNLVEFASAAGDKDTEINIPLRVPNGNIECTPSLCLSLSLLELRTVQEPSVIVQRSVGCVPSCGKDVLPAKKDELSALKAGLRKVNIFKGLSVHRTKKALGGEESSDGRSSARSEDVDYNYPFDTDSLDDMGEEESEEGNENSIVVKSISYETLAYANQAGKSFYSNTSRSEDEGWIYYSNSKSNEDSNASVLDQPSRHGSKRSIFGWRKRKLSFRAPKARGEPLLKKHIGEEGGDDIDFDRRQLSSSDEFSFERRKSEEESVVNRSSVSEFGDDNFAIGSWEHKEIVSRDGQMKLQTQVFFASIDQRSERAAGESACTALVAVIADCLQNNRDEMPIKSQLDSLIQEGSLEWRNLCENATYRERFPDKHFDLETILHARIRPLAVVPEKSFIGFFHPDGLEEEEEKGGFDYLHGAMSFDSIWDEISRSSSDRHGNGDCDPLVYIVSWNDHFFVLKVERDAYYIVDTLGERLYEGCNQAYVLKFDKDTTIQQLPSETRSSNEKPSGDKMEESNHKEENSTKGGIAIVSTSESKYCEEGDLVVCSGKESCKEYIKSFLAAIPIRELQVDFKKGLMASTTPLHHRLQIEFHYTVLATNC